MSLRSPLPRRQTACTERFHTDRRQFPDLASLASVTGTDTRLRAQTTRLPRDMLRSNLHAADETDVDVCELQATRRD